jgi:hypothetical protein
MTVGNGMYSLNSTVSPTDLINGMRDMVPITGPILFTRPIDCGPTTLISTCDKYQGGASEAIPGVKAALVAPGVLKRGNNALDVAIWGETA